MRSPGALVVFEGPEGTGKTTQVLRLSGRLAAIGTDCVAIREPGGTPLGDAMRAILLDSQHAIEPRAEALLFMASRAQVCAQIVRPALERGAVVVMDRFFLSTYAYQIHGRGLVEAEVRSANRLATDGLVPDLTILLHLPVETALQRAAARSAPDRIERSGAGFHRRVSEAFLRFTDPAWLAAHPEAGPVVRVDAAGTVDEVSAAVTVALAERLPGTFSRLAESM